MKLIDVDKIKVIENHIHYIKLYEASAVLMDLKSNIYRFEIKFTIEHKPIGSPQVTVTFKEHPHFPIAALISKIKAKIYELDSNGILASVHK